MTKPIAMAVQITLYLGEADSYQGRPLHMQVLKCLRDEQIDNAVVFHGVAGFVGGSRIKTSSLVDAGGKLPLVLIFVDGDENIARVLPKIKQMVGNRLMARENVVLENGNERG